MTMANPQFDSLPPSAPRVMQLSLRIGAGALLLCLVGWIFSAEAFFRAYLFAYLFFLGMTLGSMAWVMVHHLVGGGWGRAIQRIAESAAMNLPLMLILFIPLFFGLNRLYPWADARIVRLDAIVRHKSAYLNTAAWSVRALVFFAIWIACTLQLTADAKSFDATRSAAIALRMRRVSALGLVIYMATMTLAGIDWIMSREPHYYSTIFGFILVVGHALSGMLLLIIVLTLLLSREPLRSFVTLRHYNDLGNLLLTCVILWAYLAFTQFLLTWTGNIQLEVKWYHLRSRGFYGFLAAGLIMLHFFVPFLLLLSKKTKCNPRFLAGLASGLLCLRVIDVYWMVAPTGGPVASLNRLWLNLAAPIGVGGIWLSGFIWQLGRRPLLAIAEEDEASSHLNSSNEKDSGPHGELPAHPA